MNKIPILIFCFLFIFVESFNYRQQSIINAQKITRPLNIPYIPKPIINTLDKFHINHQAIKITTDIGKKYIISNNPTNGIHITDSNLSNKWKVEKEINVKGDKKIGEILNNANGVGNGITSYVSTGTCIGTVKAIEKELGK